MSRRPGETLSTQDLEVLETQAQVEEAEDIDIDQWLGQQAEASKQTGEVIIDGKRIRIAVVAEGEENRLIKQSRRPDPRNPREMRVDMLAFRRAYVAFSLGKAYGKQVLPDSLENMPPGVLTRLQQEINRLSQYEIPERNQDPFAFLT